MQKNKAIHLIIIIIVIIIILFAVIRITTSCYENRQRENHKQPYASLPTRIDNGLQDLLKLKGTITHTDSRLKLRTDLIP